MTSTKINQPSIEEIKKTSKVRELIKQLPFLSGCIQPERVSSMFTLVYDFEVENEDREENVFRCTKTDVEYPGTRLFLLDPLHYGASNRQAAITGMARLIIAEFNMYLKRDRISEEKMQEVLSRYEKDAMVPIPEMDEILSYDDIGMLSWWWA